MQIPQSLTAGDTWSWTDSFSDYPASTWTLTYYFVGPEAFNAVAVASGDDHETTVAATTTADYKPGTYDWIARVTDGSTVTTVGQGRLTVAPNLANRKYDHRSFWRKVLDQLEPVILGRAGTDQLSMSIAGRSLSRMSWDELLSVYDRAKFEVAGETGDRTGIVGIRFGRP